MLARENASSNRQPVEQVRAPITSTLKHVVRFLNRQLHVLDVFSDFRMIAKFAVASLGLPGRKTQGNRCMAEVKRLEDKFTIGLGHHALFYSPQPTLSTTLGVRHIFGNGPGGSIEGGFVEKGSAPRVVSRWAVGLFGCSRLCERRFWGPDRGDDKALCGLRSGSAVEFVADSLLSCQLALFLAMFNSGRPPLIPAVIADQAAQGKHGVNMVRLPAHTGLFHTTLHDDFVTTLDRTAADGVVGGGKEGVIDHGDAFVQVGQTLGNHGLSFNLALSLLVQIAQAIQGCHRSSMLQIMTGLPKPGGEGGCSLSKVGLASSSQVFLAVDEIQHAHGIWRMITHQTLQPLRTIIGATTTSAFSTPRRWVSTKA